MEENSVNPFTNDNTTLLYGWEFKTAYDITEYEKKVFNTLKAYRIGQHLHYGTSKFSLIRNIFRWTFFQWSWYFEFTPQEHNDVIIMCLLMSYLVESDI